MARIGDSFCVRIYGRSESFVGNYSRRVVLCWRVSLVVGLYICVLGVGGFFFAFLGSGY